MAMEKIGTGLRTTIVLNITAVMFITMLLTSFVVLTIARKNLLDQKKQTGEIILKSLQHIIPTFLIDSSDNSGSLQRITDRYADSIALKNLIIVDTSLTILIHQQKNMAGQKSRDPDLRQAISSGNITKKMRSYHGKNFLSMSAPFYQGNEIMGSLKISLPLIDVEESMADFQRIVVLFSILTAFTFIVIGSLLLTRYLVKPLERMIKATEDITEGYFPQDLEPTGRNEIGTLSASLSRMADKLREDRKQIEQYIHSLEKTNRQLKEAQDEVLRSEKLASVGKLAAGVAHEIGNPIGIILGYTEILRHNMNQQEENLDTLKRMENEIMRIDKIIRELLSFSRPSKTTLHSIQTNSLIEETVSLISHQKAFHAIELELKLQERLPPIMGDEQQFQQVMINLFINAMDAMPQGGKLTITTEPYSDGYNPSGVRMIIRDTGVGIEKEHLNKIFDPFYTTKSPGKGTGLGLSVSLRIIESFGGKISVESSPEKGTTFTIILPAHT
jgi:signal transduction histidine kinase